MRTTSAIVGVAAAMAVTCGALVSGQQAPPAKQPVFRSKAELVRVDVVVRDRNGAIVRGLTAADFTIAEDGKPQQVASFAFEEIRTDPLAALSTGVLGMDQLQAAAAARSVVVAPPAGDAPAAGTDAAADDLSGRRMIMLLFDTSSMQPEEIERAVKSADDYVDA